MIFYRQMKQEDIAAGLSLCRSVGWNQLSRDWELFLHLSPEGCRVGVDEAGKVVGTVTTVRYENHFGWIGMVLVDPARQRQGIGMQLLHEALHILQDVENIKLDATPAGREVYLKLNFVDEYQLNRMHIGAVSSAHLPFSSARSIQQSDLQPLINFDREVFGADRKIVLEWILQGAPQFAFLVEEQDQIKGYCFGRRGYNFTHIGPVIAQDLATAKNLVTAALQNCKNGPAILDALYDNDEWKNWLVSLGFVEQRQLIRMYRGSNSWPGIPKKQFAILGPEFG